jgi:threonine synthase
MSRNQHPSSTLEWLECFHCRGAREAEGPRSLCPKCGGVLLARYRLDEAARTLTPEALRRRAQTLWRYAEVLPGSRTPLSLGEGMTPLHEARFLSHSLGLERLLVKDESLNPTGSHRARGMTTAITMARAAGTRRLALACSGGAAAASATYGALAGLAVDLFMPDDSPQPFRLAAAACGATLHLLPGDLADCALRAREAAEAQGWSDLSALREPYRLEGKKTIGYELAEQLSWESPGVVIVPTGEGTGLFGIWKAFEEMEQLGLIRKGRRPRMVAVQAAGCAPLVRAFEQGRRRAERWSDPRTYAAELRAPVATGDSLVLHALRESRGTALAVGDQEIAAGQLEMARGEGIFPSPEGGATVAAVHKLIETGWLETGESVVLCNTGCGLNSPGIPGLRVP